MKSIRCCLGFHDFQPKEVFMTNIVNKGKIVSYAESWHGHQCIRCRKRKLVNQKYEGQSPGATQEAFNWVHSHPNSDNPTMLKVVQK